jgi:PLP dependent protein
MQCALPLTVLELPRKRGHRRAIMSVAQQFLSVQTAIRRSAEAADRAVALVAVSKTYDAAHIRPVLEMGHRIFGENRVQEAKQKWPALRDHYEGLELHLIGPLQSNKAAEAVALFDVIQTVDRLKIAQALAQEMQKQNKKPRLFVQVNTGLEPQKAGIAPQQLNSFMNDVQALGLRIEGLMCIPPADQDPAAHFDMLRQLAAAFGLRSLSMGMSGDFETAIAAGATHVRVGSAVFGARSQARP